MASKPSSLPDPEINLRDSRDFILNSALGRRALACKHRDYPVLIADLIEAIYRLVLSCHMAEFTDHGLPHLCSLVDRLSTWETPAGSTEETLVDGLKPKEAARLLLATLLHDVGMLSQNPVDLPTSVSQSKNKSAAADVASWVRQTHVDRLRALAVRLLSPSHGSGLLASALFDESIAIAESHQAWPWEWSGTLLDEGRNRGIAAALAVADLLDEDSARCDTFTLIEHREGSELNRAHWMRHALTEGRIRLLQGQIFVTMTRPPGARKDALKSVYSALRNHFRLAALYEEDLGTIGCQITNINITPSTGVPDQESSDFPRWKGISGFANDRAIAYQLLRTFMPIALLDNGRGGRIEIAAQAASLEFVDISLLARCRGSEEPVTDIEATFAALSSN